MAASDNVTTVLNKAHAMELQAITQYTNQYINLYRADFVSLADKIKSIAIEEMEHYNQIGTRIKELGGEPNVTMAKVPETNQDIKNIFKFDCKQDIEALFSETTYNIKKFLLQEASKSETYWLYRQKSDQNEPLAVLSISSSGTGGTR